VQAIMGSTARSSETIEEFKNRADRAHRLARQDAPAADDEVGVVSFGEILHSELDAFDDGSEGRITLTGPDVTLTPQLAVSLGMAVHELTTNAAKYGALSVFGGKVDITWTVTIEATRRHLDFDWVGSGGPAVSPPGKLGSDRG